jgi:regulator of protease activity HflC (stomatin/prohibitin superfamily)
MVRFTVLWTLLAVLVVVAERIVFGVSFSPLSGTTTFTIWFLGEAAVYFLSGFKAIKDWERRPVLFFGRYVRTAGPGLVWIEPLFHTVLEPYSIQDRVEEIKIENVQTHDNVRLHIITVLTTQINPEQIRNAVVEVQDVVKAVRMRAETSTTEAAAQVGLDHILEKRVEFLDNVRNRLQMKIAGWGVQVKALEIRDLRIADTQIEQSIAMKARAKKEAEAELTRAEMQKRIAEQLKEAADEYDEAAWKLKGLETLVELARSANNNTVLIPAAVLEALAGITRDAVSLP